MREEQPDPPPKPHVDYIIYACMASSCIAVLLGLLFKLTPLWVTGVIALFWSVFIYCFCPPMTTSKA